MVRAWAGWCVLPGERTEEDEGGSQGGGGAGGARAAARSRGRRVGRWSSAPAATQMKDRQMRDMGERVEGRKK